MTNFIKIVLSVLLFLCLAKMPYGYYAFVRLVSMLGFGILAYDAYNRSKEKELIIYVILVLLFQPLYKIALGRFLWNIVDIIVAVGLLISLSKKEKK